MPDHPKPRTSVRPRPAPPSLVSRLAGSAPLYAQIAEGLLDRIESGELAPGHRLPPERLLSRTLGVNRMTLRQALRRLELQGLLVRRQGDGTYVSEATKIERQAGKLVPFTRGMQRRGFKPGARVLAFERCLADSTVTRELGLRASTPVLRVHRLRLINNEPAMLETFFVAAARFPDLDRFDLVKRSVYEILESEYGVTISRARQSLEPIVASDYEARLLKIKPGAPLMLEVRLAFDQDGRPVEYGRDQYRGDRFRFVTETAPLE